jgi:hypothetical protein
VSREKSAHHVEDSGIGVDEGVRAGMVCREREREQARDLLRGGILRQAHFIATSEKAVSEPSWVE